MAAAVAFKRPLPCPIAIAASEHYTAVVPSFLVGPMHLASFEVTRPSNMVIEVINHPVVYHHIAHHPFQGPYQESTDV